MATPRATSSAEWPTTSIEQHRLGRLGPRRLHLVADGPHVLVVEVLERHERLLRPGSGTEGPGKLQDHLAGLVHVGAEELQAEGALRS